MGGIRKHLTTRRPIRTARPNRCDGGFALADSLTGLTILAMTIGLAIGAANIARRASASALDHREAARVIDQILVVPFGDLDAKSGRANTHYWRATLTPDARLSGSDAAAPCRRTVETRPRDGPTRYTAVTIETCPEHLQ